MTLKNLLRTKQLVEHSTDRRQLQRMLVAARRSLEDSCCKAISAETRLDAAYRAITQASMVALWANGFRPNTRSPGHHLTMIQALGTSIDLPMEQIALLDAFRIKRNAINYTGEEVDLLSVNECSDAATGLLKAVHIWLERSRPELA